jgi:hypothetical protein
VSSKDEKQHNNPEEERPISADVSAALKAKPREYGLRKAQQAIKPMTLHVDIDYAATFQILCLTLPGNKTSVFNDMLKKFIRQNIHVIRANSEALDALKTLDREWRKAAGLRERTDEEWASFLNPSESY